MPRYISGGDEFNTAKFKAFTNSCAINFKPRPPRRANKIGIVERKHGTIKRILERLQQDEHDTGDSVILSRANVFCEYVQWIPITSLISAGKRIHAFYPRYHTTKY